MEVSSKEDAQYLWQDTISLLSGRGLPPQLLQMLKACEAESFDGKTLVVQVRLRFWASRLKQQTAVIEQCLAEAAFAPVSFVVQITGEGEGSTLTAPVEVSAPIQTPTYTSQEIPQLQAVPNPSAVPNIKPLIESTSGLEQDDVRRDLARTKTTSDIIEVRNIMSPQEIAELNGQTKKPVDEAPASHVREVPDMYRVPQNRSYDQEAIANDILESKLTFDRFVSGEQNVVALDSAKLVANGTSKSVNPLFIYGKSGLGKTHLLRAIQHYIATNDPTRYCVYRTAAEFIDEYLVAWRDKTDEGGLPTLQRKWQNVDVLIIDDIQNMKTAAGTIRFFFDTFNALIARGKQIVLAADRSPTQLGMGDSKFDERDTSRMDSGITISIQVPDYEMKYNLINNFYNHMKQDAIEEGISGMSGELDIEIRKLMAQKAGTNIRTIEGFVQTCLMMATRLQAQGKEITAHDINQIARSKWPTGQRIITIEMVQRAVEQFYGATHVDIVGNKRNKELMEPRHVAIFLCRELTDNTLADIGNKFGNRSHSTIKHSIEYVDSTRKENRAFYDRVQTIKELILEDE